MDFEDIQVIWSTQKSEPSFAVDADTLFSRLRRSDTRVKRRYKIEEWTVIAMMMAFGGALAHEPILFGHDYHQLFGAAAAWTLGVFLLLKKYRREKQKIAFDQSIAGIVDTSIHRLRGYSKWSKRAGFWLWVVLISTVTVGVFIGGEGKTVLHHFGDIEISKRVFYFALIAIVAPFSIWMQRRSDRKDQRRIESLERLKVQLANGRES